MPIPLSQAVWGGPISQHDIDEITQLIDYKHSLLTGGQNDGTVYGDVTKEVTDTPNGGPDWDNGFLYIDSTTGPGNSPYTEDGYLEQYYSSTPPGTALGTKAAEFFGEEMTDVDGTLAPAIYPDGTLKPVGRAAFNAHYLFDDDTMFSASKQIRTK